MEAVLAPYFAQSCRHHFIVLVSLWEFYRTGLPPGFRCCRLCWMLYILCALDSCAHDVFMRGASVNHVLQVVV